MLRLLLQALKVFITLALAVIVIAASARLLRSSIQDERLKLFPVVLRVSRGESLVRIAQDLHTAGLIHFSALFMLEVRLRLIRGKFHAGTFVLHRGMSMNQIIATLTASRPFSPQAAASPAAPPPTPTAQIP